MMKKSVFIDHKDGELDPKIFNRIRKHFSSVDFVMSDDPKKLQRVKDADALFVKIFTKIDRFLNFLTSLFKTGILNPKIF